MTFNKSHYIEAGIPHSLFGRSYARLCQKHLRTLLQHHRIGGLNEGKKIDYVHAIHILMEDRGVPNTPRLYQKLCQGSRLPALQSPVRRDTLRRLLGGELTSYRLKQSIIREQGRSNSAGSSAPRNNGGTRPAETGRHPASTASVDCISCSEPLINLEAPNLRITQSCNHDRDICLDCLSQHIDIQFRDNIWDQIRCPSEGCRDILNADDVNKYAAPETVNRYNDRLARQLFQNDKAFQQCRHAPCENVQEVSAAVDRSPEDPIERVKAVSHPLVLSTLGNVHVSMPRYVYEWFSGKDSPYMVCFECEKRTCINCDTKWHPGFTCKGNMQTLKAKEIGERESAAKVAQISKQCPGCFCPTEKSGGCDHMTCQRCRHEYCWHCRADHRRIIRGNAASHNPGCIYHPSSGGAARRFPYARRVGPAQ
ncbi:MAG: hypothetical protein OHK93_005254 [Ramalina farinacea]|uniref:RBR-type E3 ubiquitin transferase n=1 Tax=Ramalina farinacea TaxID=258253 RepID=A0AA43QXH0_9LECA|nr:hypothetical protein [Ramalina farinacea]